MAALTMVKSLVVACIAATAVMTLTMAVPTSSSSSSSSSAPAQTDAHRQRRQQSTGATTSTSSSSSSSTTTTTTTTSTVLPGDALWLGDYGDGDGTPDINDYFPITYTVFGDGGVAIPRIVVPLDRGCPKALYVHDGELVAVVEVKLRVQGDFNLPHGACCIVF